MELLDNARIKQLLEQAESAVHMLARVDSHGKRQVKHALTGIYEDLGRHLHGLARQMEAHGRSASSGDGAPIALSELEDLTLDIENTDEGDEVSASPLNFSLTALPWSDGAKNSAPLSADHLAQTIANHLPNKSNADPADWQIRLENILDMLDSNEELTDTTELAIEAVKLQWATNTMPQDWLSIPKPIQVALMGLLGCRARYLAEKVPTSLAPSVVITRLQRHAKFAGLPLIFAIVDDAVPEEDSWAEDGIIWWNLLVSCVAE